MIEELDNLVDSKPFKEWIMVLGKGIPKTLTKERFITGLCQDVAYYLHIRYNLPIFKLSFLSPTSNALVCGHYFVKHKDSYFDGYNTNGVPDPMCLYWTQFILNSEIGRSGVFPVLSQESDYWYLEYLPQLKEILKKYPL